MFTPAANANRSSCTTFTFQVQDDGGTANGGVNLDQSPNTITVNVTVPSPNMPAGVLAAKQSSAAKMGALLESSRGQISQTASAPILQFARYNATCLLSMSTSGGKTYMLEYKNSLTMNLVAADVRRLISIFGERVRASLRRLLRFKGARRDRSSERSLPANFGFRI